MGNPMNQWTAQKKNNAALMTGKTMKKNMGQTDQFFHQKLMVRGGSNVWAFRDQAGADTLFDLGFGVWILFFFGGLECDGKAMNGTEKK